jgi:hypothetical protein
MAKTVSKCPAETVKTGHSGLGNRMLRFCQKDLTKQQEQNDPNKITKPMEEEWDQSDLRLRNYAQNSDRMSC